MNNSCDEERTWLRVDALLAEKDWFANVFERLYWKANVQLQDLTLGASSPLLLKPSCFFHYSEVKVYDLSGDSTLPAVSKKKKIEEVEEQEEGVAVKAKKFKAEMKG